MSVRRRALLPLLALLVVAAGVSAQEEADGFAFGLGLGLGVVTFEDGTYQKVSVSPDFAFGKVGVAFDLTFHYRFENSEFELREEDWVPDPVNAQEILGLYLSKFRYIRYGWKGDPLYAKFGSIDDGTLGNGFIMGGYANTLFLPDRRIFGLSFDIDGSLFDFPYVGLETFVGDLSAFDVLGTRLFVRPLAGTDLTIINALQIGGTFAIDRDPYRYWDDTLHTPPAEIDPDDAQAMVIGVDFRQPIVNNPLFTLAVFGDYVVEQMASNGAMVGVGGRLIQFLTYGSQLRFLGEDFVPVYFDASYDISRYARYELVESDAGNPSYIGWFASLGTSLLGDLLVFRVDLEDSIGKLDDNQENYLNYPHLRGVLEVKEGLLPGFFFDASYDKLFIREFDDLISPEGAVAKARLNYRTGPAVISFFYQLRYDENDWDDPQVTSGLETLITVN
jgi:hypothetical protein